MTTSIAATRQKHPEDWRAARIAGQGGGGNGASEAEEARKEELRRFVREKWKRIRELERQSSPGASGEEWRMSEQPAGSASRRSRESTVEYDPENPFDDDGARRTPVEQEAKHGPVVAPKRTSAGTSSKINRIPLRSTSPVKQPPTRAPSPVKKPARAASNTRQATRAPHSTTPAVSKKTMPKRDAPKRVTVQDDNDEPPSRQSARERYSDRAMTRSPSHESALEGDQGHPPTEGQVRMCTSLSEPSSIGLGDGRSEDQTETHSPARQRRRRRLEMAPSPQQPLDLSSETCNALAELEASLARLKAHSSSPEGRRKTRRSSTAKEGSGGPSVQSRRSLSPAKEMHETNLEKQRIGKAAADASSSSPPKLSFLQRVEQARAATSPSAPVLLAATPLASDGVQEARRQARSKYVPTRRESASTGGEATCTIMIGDSSVDEVVSKHSQRRFLEQVRVLVDVRDQDGEDASSGWAEKLRSAGAKVYTKVPGPSASPLSHIVYKNGRPSTLHHLRSSTQPPIVVGVNWILHCLQQGKQVAENDFLVEVGKHAFLQKVRPEQAPCPRAHPSDFTCSSPFPAKNLDDFKKSTEHRGEPRE